METAKVRLTLTYSLHGVLVLSQAQLMEEVLVPPTAEAPKANGEAAAAAAGAAAGAAEEEKKEEEGAEAAAKPAAEAAKPAAKRKFKTHSLAVATTAPGLSKAEKNAFVEVEAQMEQQDRIIRETADMRNALESYLYDMKAKLGDSLKAYIPEAEAAALVARLEEVENWLYDEGFDSTKSVYSAKLGELKAASDPVERRQEEAGRREPARAELVRQLEEFKGMVKSTEEKYSHISDEERNTVRSEEWLLLSSLVGSVVSIHSPSITHWPALPYLILLSNVLLNACMNGQPNRCARSCRRPRRGSTICWRSRGSCRCTPTPC